MNDKKDQITIDREKADARYRLTMKLAFYGTALALTFNAGMNYGIREAKKEILTPKKEAISPNNQSLFVADSIQTKIKPV
ncbi:hypothetical protein [Flavobacterium lindanitolerans]|uniref:hypothetical protein n=1 Tax=Flavobacterium lindanitolerans TaxID=428988 RepID=UPI0027BB1051|nr:hypothetical protein [Flavobacterium lindanitolerans]